MAAVLGLVLALASLLDVGDAVASRLADPELTGVTASVAIMDVASGQWLHRSRADEPMIPASNMKLLTTATALGVLGPEHLFVTRFLAAAVPGEGGALAGDLIVQGGGDPCLRADLLEAEGITDPAATLADLLLGTGLTSVEGALVLDASILDEQWVHPGWDIDDLEKSYAPPIAGLSLHGNRATVQVTGRGDRPNARLGTVSRGYSVENKVKRAAKSAEFKVALNRPDDDGRISVGGRVGTGVGPVGLDVPVRDPVSWFGACLIEQLARRGVEVRGGVVVRPGATADLGDGYELARFETPLSLALLLTNKESDNSLAEHLHKLNGAVGGAGGSFEGGSLVMERFLREALGVDTAGLVLSDGSGLCEDNRVTAEALARTLREMAVAEGPARNLFLRSLPISGRDGSLHARLGEEPYRGAVRAKTGYIGGAYALSGYAVARSGRVVAFSMLLNHTGRKSPPRNATVKPALDDVCRILVDQL